MQLQGEWPSAPAEEDLPHGAFVGLLYLQADGPAGKSTDWKGGYCKYNVAKTVALQAQFLAVVIHRLAFTSADMGRTLCRVTRREFQKSHGG